jgi:chemotaxis protein histidine kinase CheA
MDEIVREFLAESAEHLNRLDRDLAALVRDPGSAQLLAGAFRTVHTIKGTSGCLALHRLEELAHAGEALLARLCDREMALTIPVVQLLRELTAAIRLLLAQLETTGSDAGPDVGRVSAALRTLAEQPPSAAGRPATHPGPPVEFAPAGRLQPIDSAWCRLRRLVPVLAARCGKQVRLDLAGGEIELDRAVLAAIRDPLTHLVRNAVDHGIEPVAARLAAGKPACGTVRLHARTAAGRVLVEVADDGAGIDLRAVGSSALARGLVTADQLAGLPAGELRRLVFRPGLSTAPAVGLVSGRGVGMDVVKTNVEGIGGSVEIDSEPGRGTSCRLQLPQLPATEAKSA